MSTYTTSQSLPDVASEAVEAVSVEIEVQPLVAVIRRFLESTGHAALRGLEIEQEGAVILLWGTVPSYYLKRLAQSFVQQVAGKYRVANGLEVRLARPAVGARFQIRKS